MAGRRRRSYESGHTPKFLVLLDDSEECDRAIYFAARRAVRTSSGLVILTVVADAGFHEWLGVGDMIREEADQESEAMLGRAAERCRAIAGLQPELVLRRGGKAEQILELLQEDEDISFLVLAASASSEGPGPLVSTIVAKAAGTFPIPIVIVPEEMSEDDIDAIT